VRISERQYEGVSEDQLPTAQYERAMGFERKSDRKRARGHGQPETVIVTVLHRGRGESGPWSMMSKRTVPFVGAGALLQQIVNNLSVDAAPARQVTSEVKAVLDELAEEGGSTSFEIPGGRTRQYLVQLEREDRTLAEQGYEIPSVRQREIMGSMGRRVDRYHGQGLKYAQATRAGGAFGPQAELERFERAQAIDGVVGQLRGQRKASGRAPKPFLAE
jgi:hypothetical protein